MGARLSLPRALLFFMDLMVSNTPFVVYSTLSFGSCLILLNIALFESYMVGGCGVNCRLNRLALFFGNTKRYCPKTDFTGIRFSFGAIQVSYGRPEFVCSALTVYTIEEFEPFVALMCLNKPADFLVYGVDVWLAWFL